ncbi:MAG: hypothetical protein Q4D98_10745 [Planctomycetia bacterium]|nr:hypothetical protein [Planctomycetia bacterium]
MKQPFVTNSLREFSRKEDCSFCRRSTEEIATHLRIASYGKFFLSPGIRPSYDLQVVPREGFRYETFWMAGKGRSVPVLVGAATLEKIPNVFHDLISLLGPVRVTLESSHGVSQGRKLRREYTRWMDLPVLESYLLEFEPMFLRDGCSGISLADETAGVEVRLDEHKLFLVYGNRTEEFAGIFRSHGMQYDMDLPLITDGEHVHLTSHAWYRKFLKMAKRMEGTCREG